MKTFIPDEQLEDYGGRFSRSKALGYNFQPMGPVGIHVVGKGSWKEREVGKSEVEKFRQNWKEPSEVEKFLLKLESFAAVEMFWPKLESLNVLGKL